MRVAVFSGSFDPLHIGHQAIIEYLTRVADFDMVYLVVSPRSPFKDERKIDNARQRLEAAYKAAERHPELDIKVDDIEFGLPAPNYTCLTLDALKAREPQNDFTLVIGGDNLAVFDGWREYGRILRDYGVVVYPRPGYDHESARGMLLSQDPTYNIKVIDAPLVDISSTEIREKIARGEPVEALLM